MKVFLLYVRVARGFVYFIFLLLVLSCNARVLRGILIGSLFIRFAIVAIQRAALFDVLLFCTGYLSH